MANTKKSSTQKSITEKPTISKPSHGYTSENYSPDHESKLGFFAHLLSIFLWFIGPLFIFLTTLHKKGKAHDNAKNCLNFQFSMILYYIVGFILMLIFTSLLYAFFSISFVVLAWITVIPLFIIMVIELLYKIIATFKSYYGTVYQYPLTIQFIR